MHPAAATMPDWPPLQLHGGCWGSLAAASAPAAAAEVFRRLQGVQAACQDCIWSHSAQRCRAVAMSISRKPCTAHMFDITCKLWHNVPCCCVPRIPGHTFGAQQQAGRLSLRRARARRCVQLPTAPVFQRLHRLLLLLWMLQPLLLLQLLLLTLLQRLLKRRRHL